MTVFSQAIADFKNRFIFNNVKKIEYDSLDYSYENDDNLKLLKTIDSYAYISSFNTNMTTFIYKAKSFFTVKSFLFLLLEKDQKVFLYTVQVTHTNFNGKCKTKLELLQKNCFSYDNIEINLLKENLKLIDNIDALTKKDDKAYNTISFNIEVEFPETFQNILNNILAKSKITKDKDNQ